MTDNTGSVNTVRSEFQKNKSANVKPSHGGPTDERCKSCGQSGHGNSFEEKKTKCPAFDKPCHKCKKRGHFRAVCRSTVKASANAVESETGDSGDMASLSGLGVFLNLGGEISRMDGGLPHHVWDGRLAARRV